MAGTSARSTNTFPEWLLKQLQETPNGKVLPDADVEWIIDNMETPMLMKLREPQQQAYINGQSAVPPAPMQPGGVPGSAGSTPLPGGPGQGQVDPALMAALMQGGGGGGGGGMPGQVSPGAPGVRTNPSVPPQGMAELQRMLQPS